MNPLFRIDNGSIRLQRPMKGIKKPMLSDDNGDKRALANPEQLQATLNVIPAFTWYASSSSGLTFVNKRTADYLGSRPLHRGAGPTQAPQALPASTDCH
jgi:hypothetical protein